MEFDIEDTPATDTPEPVVNGKVQPESAKTIKPAKGSKATKRQPAAPRKSGKRKLSGDDWELDCEICGSKGINRVCALCLSESFNVDTYFIVFVRTRISP